MPNGNTSEWVSLEQKRAATAWNFVSPLENQARLRKGYYSLIRRLPSMVQSMGIGQALAFVMSRAHEEEAHRALRDHLTAWLMDANSPVPWTCAAPYSQPESSLMERLLAENDPEVWWFAEEEAIAFSLWLKRFTEAITPPEERQEA